MSCRMSFADKTASRITVGDVLPRGGLKDITHELDRRFFIAIPQKSQVAKASCSIVGGQGSGKSELLNYRVWVAYGIYGRENVHVIYTDDIRVALDLIDDRPVQYIIVDDAMTYASSREVFQQTEIVKVYNRSRHVYEERLHGKPGLILYDWAWQRFGELDPSFRQSDVQIFKTGIAEPSERRTIESFLGKFYTGILWQIWDRMNRGNNAVKALSVGRIASLDPQTGVGLYRSEMVERVLPGIIRHDDHFRDEGETETILAGYREDPVWAKRILCYGMSAGGMKQTDIAAKVGVRQGYVSEAISKVRKLLQKK